MAEPNVEERLREQKKQLERAHTGRLVFLLRGLEEQLGPQVVEVVERISGEAIRARWAQIAEKEGNTIEDFIRVLWEPLRAEGFEFTSEVVEGGVQMRCTRCPLVDLAREIDAADWLYRLNCGSDPHMVAGFNPKMGFRRTKTLMQGDDCCDHFYYYLEE
jgi:predicted ArsR family transcriptional regulator